MKLLTVAAWWAAGCLLLAVDAALLHRALSPAAPPAAEEGEERTMHGTFAQTVTMFNAPDCAGPGSPAFSAAGSASVPEFRPYAHNLGSVRVCGKGIFFYFDTP